MSNKKTDFIVRMINKLGRENNTIDLDAYGRGLSDMYDALNNIPSSASIIESALNAIQEVEYNTSSEGCGLEDQGITDRYEAMEHGYQNGLDAAYEAVKHSL